MRSQDKTSLFSQQQQFELQTFDLHRCFPPFIMDIKTLLDNLHEHVSCSVCMCTFTEPKQLPCLHSFCLHCLKGLQRTSPIKGEILCPECRKNFRIPGSGNPSEFPTNFKINSLLDVLAIKECNTTGAKCGNCDERSAGCFYCFQCCAFWCEGCITVHNLIRANKEHRTLALKDFQDQDIEEVLKRPAFCQKKGHEKEELKFFCKVCEVAICSACALTHHDGHAKILLEDGANEHKQRIDSAIKSLKEKAQEKRNEVSKLDQNSIEVQVQVADVKSQAQATADQLIAIIEARKQDIFNAVDNQAKETLDRLALKKGEVENQVKMIESAIKETETIMRRSSSAEILGFNETFDTILQQQGTQCPRDPERIPRFSFTESKKLFDMLNSEGIGNVSTYFSNTKAQQLNSAEKGKSKQVPGLKQKHVHGSPFEVQVETRRFRPVLSFGQSGPSVGMLSMPWGVAVNNQNQIAVTELVNSRVSVFSSDGTHLRSFGRLGGNQGEFDWPGGIAFDNNGNIIVADFFNHRVQVFSGNGKCLRKFGGKGSLDHQLKNPEGLSVTRNGDIIVADSDNKFIKIFSPSGKFLRKFGGEGSLVSPFHCIQTQQYLMVSDFGEHCIKVFDLQGNFRFKFGKVGHKEGEFNGPVYLSVSKSGHLVVCDAGNHRLQVFEQSGKFVTMFGTKGSETGEFNFPVSTANLSDGRIVVSDHSNDRIQILEFM